MGGRVGQHSNIEWTDATWNPVTGCTRISAGCDHCYAATLAQRLLARVYLAREPVSNLDGAKQDPFAVRLWPERLEDPLRWHEPRHVFVNSMSDLFHKDVPAEFVTQILDVMLAAPWHVYQILTKRPSRARRFVESHRSMFPGGVLPWNVWIGTSVENQEVAFRVAHLRQVPARVRFLSCEPLIGPLELDLREIHWVIAGGESGIKHRPVKIEWVRAIRDRCLASGVPFFFKQWGGRTPKAGGRRLDGRFWNDMPVMPTAG